MHHHQHGVGGFIEKFTIIVVFNTFEITNPQNATQGNTKRDYFPGLVCKKRPPWPMIDGGNAIGHCFTFFFDNCCFTFFFDGGAAATAASCLA